MNKIASDQLQHLASLSRGAIQILRTSENKGWTWFKVSLDTSGIPHTTAGIRLRGREVIEIGVNDAFPFEPPSTWTLHRRWAGTPHVQWGRHLCVYAAPSIEWNPADGMRGFIARLSLWLQRAAAGTLDPDGQPLHPPVAYPAAIAGQLVIHPDLGSIVPWGSGTDSNVVYAWCVEDGDRVDVVAWLPYLDSLQRVLREGFEREDSRGRPYFLAPCILIDGQIGFEYPSSAADLGEALEKAGVPTSELLQAIARAGMVNAHLKGLSASADTSIAPNLVLLGTPSRRVIGPDLLAHISAWRLEDFGNEVAELLAETEHGALEHVSPQVFELAQRWLGFAETAWMKVHEERPEVTNRRDKGTSISSFVGKRVLVLGCGALGAPIAEHLVRAGIGALTVVDKGIVGPGILVRQPYYDADIGVPKARALSHRLSEIRRDLKVTPVVGDVIHNLRGSDFLITDFDLVVDATADVGVRAAIERSRLEDRPNWPDLITVIIGHTAEMGLAAISPSGSSGGGVDVLRRVAMHARVHEDWADVAEDFFPAVPRTELFFPEPGCSSPTFVGSSAQVGALAATLITTAASILLSATDERMSAIAVRPFEVGAGPTRLTSWPSDLIVPDAAGGEYEIRISRAAIGEMRAEARRGARLRPGNVETGGMVLGAFDDASRVVNVDLATGPPPDSMLSSVYFDHGIEGTQELIEHHAVQTANVTGFVGMWHSHPLGPASPSMTDEDGMTQILKFGGTGRRALMIIIGGFGDSWTDFRDSDAEPTIYGRVVEDTHLASAPLLGHGRPVSVNFYPGGYRSRPPHQVPSKPWWRRGGRP